MTQSICSDTILVFYIWSDSSLQNQLVRRWVSLFYVGLELFPILMSQQGCESDEIVTILFLNMITLVKFWLWSLYWLDINCILLDSYVDHAIQFGGSILFSKKIRSNLHLICPTCVWNIWKERNYNIFHNKSFFYIRCWIKWKCYSFFLSKN